MRRDNITLLTLTTLLAVFLFVACSNRSPATPKPESRPVQQAADVAPNAPPTPSAPAEPQPTQAPPVQVAQQPSAPAPTRPARAVPVTTLVKKPEPSHAAGAAPPAVVTPPRPVVPAAHEEAAPANAPAATPVACGEDGQPMCPLQGWMEHNLQAAVEADDAARVARGLARAVKFAPSPDWNSGDQGWSHIAEIGAAAANAGDLTTARQSCKGCHKAWRAKYKAGFRMRPIAE